MNDRNRELDLDNLDDPEALVADHERELLDQQSRLDLLEDRLNAALPIANTPQGGAQRFMLEIPLPRTVFAVGAIGNDTSYSRAIGPGGFGLETTQSLGVHVERRTCIDTDGLTIVHSGGSARVLTQEDLALASAGPLRVGTNDGAIEISAGSVSIPDPKFTVVPSMRIPDEPLEVDTASPRSTVEGIKRGWDGVWRGVRTGASLFQKWENRGSPVSAPSIAPRAAQIGGKILSGLSAVRSGAKLAMSAVEAALSGLDIDTEWLGPSHVRIHAENSVDIAARGKVGVFGASGVKCSSPVSAELRGGLSAAVYSPVSATCYGVGGAKLKSEGITEVSGRYVVAKGSYVEVQARTAAALTSAGDVTVKALENGLVEAPTLAIKADKLHVAAKTIAEVASDSVLTHAESTNTVKSDKDVVVEAGAKVDIKVEEAHVEVHPNRVAIKPGGTNVLNVQRGAMSYGNIMRVTESRTTIRGECSFG